MRICAAFVILFAWLTPALAQNPAAPAATQPSHPDFSGTWLLRVPVDEAKKSPPPTPEIVVIVCTDTEIDVHPKDAPHKLTKYFPDGEPRETGFMQELDRTFRTTTWSGSQLVSVISLHSLSPIAVGPNKMTERWTLSSDGQTLTQSIDEWKSLTRVFDKQ